jgi:hypothetical protein
MGLTFHFGQLNWIRSENLPDVHVFISVHFQNQINSNKGVKFYFYYFEKIINFLMTGLSDTKHDNYNQNRQKPNKHQLQTKAIN